MQLSFKSDRSKTYYQNKCIYSFYFLCGSFIGALYFFMWIQVTVCILCFQSVGLPLVFLIGQVCLATNSSSFCLSGNVLFSLILKDNFAWLTVFFFFFLLFVLLLPLASMVADEKSTQYYHRSLLCDNMLLSPCFQDSIFQQFAYDISRYEFLFIYPT